QCPGVRLGRMPCDEINDIAEAEEEIRADLLGANRIRPHRGDEGAAAGHIGLIGAIGDRYALDTDPAPNIDEIARDPMLAEKIAMSLSYLPLSRVQFANEIDAAHRLPPIPISAATTMATVSRKKWRLTSQ